MSSESDEITAILHRFAVKWSIPADKLRYVHSIYGKKAPPRIITSNIYRFKEIKDLEFSFRFTCDDDDYYMAVDCRTGLPIFQDDALILVEDRIYRVKCNATNAIGKSVFKPLILAHNYPKKEDTVTVYCLMSIFARVKAVISNPPEDETWIKIIDCESILANPGFHPDGYDDVNEFEYSFRMPNFNVDMAMEMISKASQRKHAILKGLCAEYLMENLTPENVFEILKLSLSCDVRYLSDKCVEFISERCRIVPRDESCSPNESLDE